MNARQERVRSLNRELIPQPVVYLNRGQLGTSVWGMMAGLSIGATVFDDD